MIAKLGRALAVVAALLAFGAFTDSQAAEQRIALVIGNSAYVNAPSLANPANDARLMSSVLREQGFEVIERLDANQESMRLAVTEFGKRLEAAHSNTAGGPAVGLFYFAGHGLQVAGENYLVPIGAPIQNESHVRIYTVSAGEVLGVLDYASNGLNIVVLDACRNNPIARSFRDSARGLAPIHPPTGTLVAYSTAPGQVALDGAGSNSPYTEALARAIKEPGMLLEVVFKRVVKDVVESTGGDQTPWTESSVIGDFYFSAPEVAVADPPDPVPDPVQPRPSGEAAAFELAFWDTIKNSRRPEDFEDYLARYPNGTFVGIARRTLAELQPGDDVAVVVPPVVPVVVPPPGIDVEPLDSILVALRNSNLRAGPSTDFDKSGRLTTGQEVRVTGKVVGRDWYRVALAGGGEAYVWAPLLGEPAPVITPPVDDGSRAAWARIQNSDRLEDFEVFLAAYPNSPMATAAVEKLTRLRGVAVIVPPRPNANELHVDDSGGRDYTSIQAAIDAASAGMTIFVHPGTYRQGMIITKSVAIVGTGDRSEVVVESTGADVAWFQGGDGSLANMTLRQMGGGSWYGVDISAGSPTLRNLDIASQSLANVAIREGADPTVRDSRIHDSPESGVYVYDNGRGTIFNNDIVDNIKAGITVATGASPSVVDNRISGNGYEGVWVIADAGGGHFENNDLRGNGRGAWDVEAGAGPVVRVSNLPDNGGAPPEVTDPPGLHVAAAGGRDYRVIQDAINAATEGTTIYVHPGTYTGGMLVDKTIEIVGIGDRDQILVESEGADVAWFQGGNGRLANMTLRQLGGGSWYGVDISAGSPTLENLDIASQSLANIAIREGADPTIRDSYIHDSPESGLYIYDNGRGTIENNDIIDNAKAGISVATGGRPVVMDNRISGSGYEGVWVISDAGGGRFEGNDLRGNGRGAWDVEAGAGPVIRVNNLPDDGSDPSPEVAGPAGLHVAAAGGRDYRDLQDAIDAATAGTTIYVHPGTYTRGIVIDKTIEIVGLGDRDRIRIEVSGSDVVWFQGGDGRLANMTLRQQGDGNWYGIDVSAGSPIIENVDVSSQSLAVVAIHDGANPLVRDSTVHDGAESGIYVYDNGRGTIENNEIYGNSYAGIAIRSGGDPVVRYNVIRDGQESGLHIYEEAFGTIEDNEISGHALAGIEIKERSNPAIYRNRVYGGQVSGIYVHADGSGTIEDNEIFANAYSGVEIKDGGNPVLRNNSIYKAGENGVFVNNGGLGTIIDNDIQDNAHAGIVVHEGASPVVRNNRINRNGYEAIWVRTGGSGRFENNDLTNNDRGAWDIEDGAGNLVRTNNRL